MSDADRTARIQLDAFGQGTITVDDHDLSMAVRGVELTSRVGERTRLTLDLAVTRVETEAGVELFLREETRQMLVTFGWTPPSGPSDASSSAVEPRTGDVGTRGQGGTEIDDHGAQEGGR